MKEPEFVPSVFTDDQIKKLVRFSGRRFFERRLHLLILILLDTGCRVSEGTRIRVADVDLDNLLLTLTGKGRKQRKVPCSLELRKSLYRYIRDFEPKHLLLAGRAGDEMGRGTALARCQAAMPTPRLWVATELDKPLSRCTDAQIAELLLRAEERLPIFEADFAVVEHARRRLLRSGQQELFSEANDGQAVRGEGVHILKAEAAFYRASIPNLQLPFQRNRFASDMFMVPDVREAKACLMAAGFRKDEQMRSMVVDADSQTRCRSHSPCTLSSSLTA
jgi:Phage integrase family